MIKIELTDQELRLICESLHCQDHAVLLMKPDRQNQLNDLFQRLQEKLSKTDIIPDYIGCA